MVQRRLRRAAVAHPPAPEGRRPDAASRPPRPASACPCPNTHAALMRAAVAAGDGELDNAAIVRQLRRERTAMTPTDPHARLLAEPPLAVDQHRHHPQAARRRRAADRHHRRSARRAASAPSARGATRWRPSASTRSRSSCEAHGIELSGYCRGGFFPHADAAGLKAALRRQPPRHRRSQRRWTRPAWCWSSAPCPARWPARPRYKDIGRARSEVHDGIAASLDVRTRGRHAAGHRAAAPDAGRRPRLHQHAGTRARPVRRARSRSAAARSAWRSTSTTCGGTRSCSSRSRAPASERLLAYHVCDWLTPTRDLLNDRGMMGDGVDRAEEDPRLGRGRRASPASAKSRSSRRTTGGSATATRRWTPASSATAAPSDCARLCCNSQHGRTDPRRPAPLRRRAHALQRHHPAARDSAARLRAGRPDPRAGARAGPDAAPPRQGLPRRRPGAPLRQPARSRRTASSTTASCRASTWR